MRVEERSRVPLTVYVPRRGFVCVFSFCFETCVSVQNVLVQGFIVCNLYNN